MRRSPSDFLAVQKKMAMNVAKKLQPVVGIVTGTTDTRVLMKDVITDIAREQEYARILGPIPEAGAGVILMVIPGEGNPGAGDTQIAIPYIRTTPSRYRFDNDVSVVDESGLSVASLFQDYGVEVEQGRWIKGWSGVAGVGTPNFQINGSDGAASFLGGISTLKFATYTDNSAVNGTNSSNADPKAINIETTIALGSGNWQVWALGIGSYYNATADTTVDQVMEIDGVEGALTNLRVGVRSSGYTAWGCEHDRTNRTGTIPIRIMYKNNSASTTTTAGGGVILVRAMRTS